MGKKLNKLQRSLKRKRATITQQGGIIRNIRHHFNEQMEMRQLDGEAIATQEMIIRNLNEIIENKTLLLEMSEYKNRQLLAGASQMLAGNSLDNAIDLTE